MQAASGNYKPPSVADDEPMDTDTEQHVGVSTEQYDVITSCVRSLLILLHSTYCCASC